MEEEKKVLTDEELDNVDGGSYGVSGRTICHTVVEGDNLLSWAISIAPPVCAIMALNSIIRDPNEIRIGWVLTIPDNR